MTSIIALRCGRYMQLARGAMRLEHRDADFERREMRGEQQHALTRGERVVEVLPPVDRDPRQHVVERREPAESHLDERSMPTASKCRFSSCLACGRVELRKADLEVAPRRAQLAALDPPQQRAEPAADRELPRRAATERRRASPRARTMSANSAATRTVRARARPVGTRSVALGLAGFKVQAGRPRRGPVAARDGP